MFSIRKKKGKRINHVLDLLVKLAYMNLLWLGFSMIGLGLFGIFPATFALFRLCRDWNYLGESKVSFNKMKEYYKEEFVAANSIGWIGSLIGILLYVNYTIMVEMGTSLSFFVPVAYYILLFIYLMGLLWFIPLWLHRHGTIRQHVRNALVIGISYLPRSVILLIVGFAIGYVSLSFLTLLIFYTWSMMIAIWCTLTLAGLEKVQFKEVETKSE